MSKNIHRCEWVPENNKLYIDYHDKEWGVPVKDDATLFEFLVLETFQAGLSWITILKKRENFRAAFDDFDYTKIADYSPSKVDSLLQNAGIVRNRLKIKATITNAQAFLEVHKEFGSFYSYIWGFINNTPIKNTVSNYKTAPANTSLSDHISKELKKKGFKFVGSTVVYAHMQATGMVNDHEISCFRYEEV